MIRCVSSISHYALGVTVLWLMCVVCVAALLWATLYRWIGLSPNWEEAVYFSSVAYKTLGCGDVLLPIEWRLLSGLEALSGLLMIGLQVAMLVEVISWITPPTALQFELET